MKQLIVLIVASLVITVATAQTKTDSWALFAKTKFDPKYYEKIQEYLFYPTFSPDLKAMEGKEITIEGYYVPFAPEDGKYIIISKFPMSQCFFCGGAGPVPVHAGLSHLSLQARLDPAARALRLRRVRDLQGRGRARRGAGQRRSGPLPDRVRRPYRRVRRAEPEAPRGDDGAHKEHGALY